MTALFGATGCIAPHTVRQAVAAGDCTWIRSIPLHYISVRCGERGGPGPGRRHPSVDPRNRQGHSWCTLQQLSTALA